MALDPSISMQSKTAGLAPNLATGLKLGYDMSQMPRMGRQAQLKEQQGVRGDKQSQLMEIYAAYGKDSVDPAGFQDFQIKMQEAGFPVDGMTLENANRALQMGKNLTAAKSQASANANRVVNTAELGGGAMQITYADGRTEVVTPTEEQRKAIELAQTKQISYEEALNEARGRGRTAGGLEAELTLSDQVAEAEAKKAAAISKAKTAAEYAEKLASEPELRTQIAAAQERGKARGEAEASLAEQRANMPMLEETVAVLESLSDEATYTKLGRARNWIFRELGLDAPEGAEARVAYQTTVDNVVLPLLKATFGSQFTEKEGQRLADTLGSADYSPKEKQRALSEFMKQKRLQLSRAEKRAEETGVESADVGDKRARLEALRAKQ